MKSRIAVICIALLLVGSLAYAADRKRQEKKGGLPPETLSGEEALQAELLEAVKETAPQPAAPQAAQLAEASSPGKQPDKAVR